MSVVMAPVVLSWSFVSFSRLSSLGNQLLCPGTSLWHCSLHSCLFYGYAMRASVCLGSWPEAACHMKDLKEAHVAFCVWLIEVPFELFLVWKLWLFSIKKIHLFVGHSGTWLHSVELLAKGGSHGNPQTSQADAKTKGCSPKIDSGAPLLRIMSTQQLNMEKSSWCLHGASSLCSIQVSLMWEGILQSTERETWTPT